MHLFGDSEKEKEEFDLIKELVRDQKTLISINAELIRRQLAAHPVHLVLTTIINNSNYQIMALTIASNQQAAGTLGLVDSVTSLPVTGTFTGVSASSDNQSAFTASVDASGNVSVVAQGTGSANLTVTATTAFTDSTGAAQSQSLTVTIPVTVTSVVTADAVALTVTFGNPTAK